MILEVAQIDIRPGSQSDFESALAAASDILSQADGHLSHRFHRCIETDTRYVILVEWRSVADHVDRFRQSPAFAEYRDRLSPFFTTPPTTGHFTLVLDGTHEH
jgi:heme-degrading monooxygenase HmoA